eukprot:scaffold422179_cov86-Attheya_sp.AAC.1
MTTMNHRSYESNCLRNLNPMAGHRQATVTFRAVVGFGRNSFRGCDRTKIMILFQELNLEHRRSEHSPEAGRAVP